MSLIYSLLSVLAISLISLAAIFFLFSRFSSLSRFTLYLVSFAVGSLLGDAFIHLLPQSFATLPPLTVSLLTISGLLLFFSLEQFLRWRHCHDPDCSSPNPSLLTLNLLGDTVHNFLDGMLIAASFMVSFPLGFTTSLAVLFHEIPQEIGDFGIFLHHGLSLSRSFLINLLSALAGLLGVLFVFLLGRNFTQLSVYLLPVTAGGFIYLASSDLIPEIHRHTSQLSHSFSQLVFILLGVLLMVSLTYFN